MASWVCADCTTVYTVGAPRCPHCHSENHTEEGDMPKITVHGGASIAVGGVTVSATWENTETAGAVTEPPASTAPAPTEEDACPGSSSPASSETEPQNTEPSSSATPSRARTTASRSRKARTVTSSATGTDGDPEADTSATTSD